MSWDESWRVVARRRQRQRPAKSEPWWIPSGTAGPLLWLVVPPPVLLIVLGWVAHATQSRGAGYAALLSPIVWLFGFGYVFNRNWRTSKAISPSGARSFTEQDLLDRISREYEGDPEQVGGVHVPRVIVASTWTQYGDQLLQRERDIAALAEARGWQFRDLDAATTGTLNDAGVTTFAPPLCRNVCSGEHRGTPFTLTDLTLTRYKPEQADKPQNVRLVTSTMCVMPFAAPQTLHIVDRKNGLAHTHPGRDQIRAESADFNARYRVSGQDNAWTMLVLNPFVLDLVMTSDVTSLVIDGGRLAVAVEPWHPPDRLPALLDLTDRIRLSALTAASPEDEEPLNYYV